MTRETLALVTCALSAIIAIGAACSKRRHAPGIVFLALMVLATIYASMEKASWIWPFYPWSFYSKPLEGRAELFTPYLFDDRGQEIPIDTGTVAAMSSWVGPSPLLVKDLQPLVSESASGGAEHSAAVAAEGDRRGTRFGAGVEVRPRRQRAGTA